MKAKNGKFDGMLPSRKSQRIDTSVNANASNARPNSPGARGIVPVGRKKGKFPLGK